MTLTPELKQAIEKAGDEPVRVEDPETHTAYLIVREDVYRRMYALTAIDHSDRSLYAPGADRSLRRLRASDRGPGLASLTREAMAGILPVKVIALCP